MMKLKIIVALIGLSMVAVPFLGMASEPVDRFRGTPEIVISRVAPATDGTHASLPGNQPNGICYVWEQAEPFSPSVSVCTFGTNTKGIATDTPGFWIYNATYDQSGGDVGSIWDAWYPGENAVMVYEVFDDQSTTGRNYTMIYEDQMDGDGSTNYGGGVYPVAPNILTPINDPYLISLEGYTCVIGISQQTTGFEVSSLFDGYGVYKSTAGPITQTNQGTFLGDATFDGSIWKYTDPAWVFDSWYAVRVKWDGGTFPFYAPLYSYGMSNNLWAYPPPPGPYTFNLAASPNPHDGNIIYEYVTLTAIVSDSANEGDIITAAEVRIDGGVTFAMMALDGAYDEVTEDVIFYYYFPNGYSEGAHAFEVRGCDYFWGDWVGSIFTITDTTAPVAVWNTVPGATAYINQSLYFNASYGDFRPYNPAVAASYFQYRVNNGSWNNFSWVNQSFTWGSYMNNLTYTIPGDTFAVGDWVDYCGQVRDTAATPNTAILMQGSCQIIADGGFFDIPIVSGWNLMSFPVMASGPPAAVLDDMGGDTAWSVIKWFNPLTPEDLWKTYRIGSPVNDLTYIDNTMGLWICITDIGSDGMLRVEGDDPGTTNIPLYVGWNLVGYPSLTPETVANALWGTGVDRVGVFDPAEPCLIKEAGPTYIMHAGEGYWVHTIADSVWTVDW